MNRKEFSDSFTVLLNSYARGAGFGEQSSVTDIILDEYEKSVFLTKAQNDIVIELYNGTNKLSKGFEETEELRRYLDPLVATKIEQQITIPEESNIKKVSKNSCFFELPPDLLFITLEQVNIEDEDCKYTSTITVVPTAQDSYSRIKNNPFKGPTKYRALRLDCGSGVVEIIPPEGKTIESYLVRYLREPKPIILENFKDQDLYIGEEHGSDDSEVCELNSALHNLILERAVYLALQYKGISLSRDNK